LHATSLFPIWATRPVNLIFPCFITRIKFGDLGKSCR
jgi:hypothetical protein